MRALTTILLAAMLGGCSDGARITILLTDAPADLRAAVVTIDQIYLQGETGRVVLRDAPYTTDLLILSDDVATLVEDAVVPAGTYEQLRFVIGGAYIELGDGAIYATPDYALVPADRTVTAALRTPSWDTSGFKVGLPGGLVLEGDQRVLVVDFDVGESFGQQTGNGAWIMRPVLHATDLLATGSISIVASVRAVELTDPISIVLTDAAGNREGMHSVTDDDDDGDVETVFSFLDPREGPFTITMPGVETAPAMPMSVPLGSGQSVLVELDVRSVQR